MTAAPFLLFLALSQAGTIAEVREMTSDFSLYAADHWNPTDLLGLSLVTGGLAVRIADETSSWGRALYALSAPLMFSRILFYAQMLRFQGPMIQASKQPLQRIRLIFCRLRPIEVDLLSLENTEHEVLYGCLGELAL